MSTQNKNLTGGRTADAKSNFGGKGWLMVLVSALYYILLISFDNGLSFIVPVFEAAHGWNQTTLFLFTTIGGWVAVAFILIFGIVKRIKGNKRVIVISMIIYLVCLLLWTFAQNIAMYAIGAIGVKASGTVFVFLGVAGIASNWFPTKKGLFMGWATMGVTAATLIATLALPGLLAKGIVVAFGFFLILGIITFILTLVFVKDTPEEAGAYPDNDRSMSSEQVKFMQEQSTKIMRSSPWTLSRSLKSPTVWIIALIFSVFNFVTMATASQTIMAGISFGHALTTLQLVMTIGCIVNLFFNYIGGVVDQKLGTRIATLLCMVMLTVALLLMGLLGTITPLFCVACMLTTAATGIGNNMMISLSTTIWGRYDMDTPYTIILMVQMVISSFGYTVLSALSQSFGYGIALCIFACVVVIAIILTAVLRDKFLGRTTEEVMAVKQD